MRQLLVAIFAFITLNGFAQVRSKLVILDSETRVALAKAKILIDGNSNVFYAGEDGTFFLPSDKREFKLSVFFVGYEVEQLSVTAPLTSDLKVFLRSEANVLEDVQVNTGYQRLSKERSNGSFTVLDNKLLNQQVGRSILSRLESVSSGLIADRSTSSSGRLMIRGISSIRGPKEPLIVLDNFPYEGDLNNINPNDVESVTILKDAAAASIWGSRAGNGVVVITTKSGKYGAKTAISVNMNAGYSPRPDLSRLPQMSSSDFVETEIFLYGKGFYNSQINSATQTALTPLIELLLKRDNGSISGEIAQQEIARLKSLDVRNDFRDYVYRNMYSNQLSLSLSGGGTAYKWISSAGYDRSVSELDAKYNRFNSRTQVDFKPLKDLELTSGVYFTHSASITGRSGYGSVLSVNPALYPYAEFADQNGRALPIPKGRRISYLNSLANGLLGDWAYYPLDEFKHTQGRTELSDLLLNAGVKYKLPLGFSLDFSYQFERQQSMGRTIYDAQSYFARNTVNDFAQFANGTVQYKVPKGGILDNVNNVLLVNNFRGLLKYGLQKGDHDLSAFVGVESRDAETDGITSRLYGFRDDILTSGTVDYTTQYPSLSTGNSSFILDRNGVSNTITRFVSVFSNAAYSYKSRYTLTLSGRRDASNLFGLNTNNKWNPLWSAGLGWNIDREAFFGVKWISLLKLRATYGVSGNIDPSMTAITTIAYVGTNPNLSEPYARFNNYANPDLKWENITMMNLGADFSLLNSRISGSVEFFHKKGKDLFGNALLDYTGGVGNSILKNVAEMSGNGVEIQLNSVNVDRELRWTTSFNFTKYADRIDKYFLLNMQGSSFLGTANSPPVSGVIGNPVYSVYAYKWGGLDPINGDPIGVLKGQPSKNYSEIVGAGTQLSDLRYFGSAIPRVFGTFGNSFRFRGLEISIQISYKLDYFFKRNSIQYGNLFSTGLGHSDFALRWTKPGDELNTNVPSQIYPNVSARDNFYRNAEVLVSRGDHIRLQYVNLSYTPPLRFKKISNLTVYANVSNLGIIWAENKEGLDPDYEIGVTALGPSKIFSIGLRASF
ncbi:SusC/RagA family TonB-linked outer membrane protein [Pedobacter sp. R-06]|uniref:SusC/RagA family TonB-linked outer membrane protein n=1 Tax=Pedobacter sp. R-06 TaxID=3404051 RepID=UPI003CF17883